MRGTSPRSRGVVRLTAAAAMLLAPRAGAEEDAPRRVDLAIRDADARQVLLLLAREAEVDLVVAARSRPTISLHLREVRPIDAMTAVAHAAGWRVVRDDAALAVREASDGTAPRPPDPEDDGRRRP